MTAIPDEARTIVKRRARWRCERCGAPAPGGHWHHRRSRSVHDAHQHCACNGVWLCHTCHTWVHQNPAKAREAGWIVSRFTVNPYAVPVPTYLGERTHECDGTYHAA